MLVTLPDGYNLNVEELGSGFPLIVLTRRPGPRPPDVPAVPGPARDRVPASLRRRARPRPLRARRPSNAFARSLRARRRPAGAGATARPVRAARTLLRRHHRHVPRNGCGTAAAYVISGGADESNAMLADVEASLEAMGEAGEPIAASWEDEKTVQTEEHLKQLLRVQMPFHFYGEPPPGYAEETLGSPDVLRHFANAGYGEFDYRPKLAAVKSRRSSSSASTIARRRLARRGSSMKGLPAANWSHSQRRPPELCRAAGHLPRRCSPLPE